MKKTLLFAAALVCAATVNAQVFQMNGEDFGITSEGTFIDKDAHWGPAGNVGIWNPYPTDHKLVDCKCNNYNKVVFNGVDEIITKNGVQGQDNPKDIDGGNPGITLQYPVSGAAIAMRAGANGYVYVVAKLSSNKNYYMFEEQEPTAFTLAMQVENANFPDNIIKYTAQGVGEYDTIEDNKWTDWPEKVALGDKWESDIKVNGLGVICFPVYQDLFYLVGAGGSKISWCGVYYSPTPVSVVLQGTDEENPVEDFVLISAEEGNAISNVKAESNHKAIYNVAGQKMVAAKGLSIVNGKVIMVK